MLTRKITDINADGSCPHRGGKNFNNSAYRQISLDNGGKAIMKCARCGDEKTVTVVAEYINDRNRKRR